MDRFPVILHDFKGSETYRITLPFKPDCPVVIAVDGRKFIYQGNGVAHEAPFIHWPGRLERY